jgi:hypothetical protein
MEMSLGGNNAREKPVDRAAAFVSWVMGNDIRLGCLRLAVKSHGGLARVGVDRVLAEANNYLEFVAVKVEAPVTRKRGRPRNI